MIAPSTSKRSPPPTDSYRAKAASTYTWLEHLTWNVDGSRFAFIAVHDAYPAEVSAVSGSTWTTTRIDRNDAWQVVGYGRALGASVLHAGVNELYVATEKDGRVGLRRMLIDGPAAGTVEDFFPGKQVLAFDFGEAKGTAVAAAVLGDAAGFPKLMAVRVSASVLASIQQLVKDDIADPNRVGAARLLQEDLTHL